MTTEQHHDDHIPAAGYRPRRSPTAGLPRLAEADRPDPDELARQRKQAQRRWVPVIRSR